MPSGIIDESIWQRAKEEFAARNKRAPSDEPDWAVVVAIYKNMGGRFA